MPVIKLQQQVRKSRPGEIISIECTDPGAEKDITSWARVNKHSLQGVVAKEFGQVIFIKVKASP
jgi:tRNA 2-thiouridine synthesizing protein A